MQDKLRRRFCGSSFFETGGRWLSVPRRMVLLHWQCRLQEKLCVCGEWCSKKLRTLWEGNLWTVQALIATELQQCVTCARRRGK